VAFNRSISGFVIPVVTNGGNLVSHRYDDAKAFWHLQDEISRDIRMAPFALDGPETPLPSFDTEVIAFKRRRAAANLSKTIPFQSVMGEADAILDYLSKPKG
jgi:hypothetical protein